MIPGSSVQKRDQKTYEDLNSPAAKSCGSAWSSELLLGGWANADGQGQGWLQGPGQGVVEASDGGRGWWEKHLPIDWSGAILKLILLVSPQKKVDRRLFPGMHERKFWDIH